MGVNVAARWVAVRRGESLSEARERSAFHFVVADGGAGYGSFKSAGEGQI